MEFLMNIKTIDCGLEKIEKIVHISDIHCRLLKRHDEYRDVFSKLYKEIESTPKNTLIVNTGDTHHNKTDLSSEGVHLIAEFLKNLSDLRPTILILGNHDLNLSNSNRLDCLTPIVKALNHENLFYLKDTGLYKFSNCLFNVMSVLDEPENYIDNNTISDRYKNNVDCLIDLYHGSVNDVKTNLGYVIKNPRMTLEKFDGADIAMLGDIHLHKVLQEYDPKNNKPIVVYASSLINQDHSECDDYHGYCYWDIKTRSFDYKKIKNDYGFFTIEVKDGKLVTDLTNCPLKPRLRVKCFNSGVTEVKEIVSEIRKLREISDITYVRCDDDKDTSIASITNNKLDELNVSSVDSQNQLIVDYLKSNNPNKFSDDDYELVQKINRHVNANLPKEDCIRNVNWKIKKLEFDNMFAYGEGNVIDFTKVKDVVGLFSKNASGKSSLLSCLCFALFDKTERTVKSAQVINSQKMTFKCKVNFEINNVDYWIERIGTRDKKGSVKVNVNFWKNENGEDVSLNDEARRGTNAVIRDYIGTYEDFSITSLALQGKDSSFLELGQTEKKDLFTRLIGINIFDRLFSSATESFKELNGVLKSKQKEDFTKKLSDIETDIIEQKRLSDTFKSEHDECVVRKETINSKLLLESKKLITLNDTPTDYNSLIKKRDLYQVSMKKAEDLLKTTNETLSTLVEDALVVKGEIEKLNTQNITEKYNELKELEKEKNKLQTQLDLKKVVIEGHFKKIKHLESHKYDPNCKFCSDNVFVKDAISSKAELEKEKPIVLNLSESIKDITSKIENLKHTEEQYKTLSKLNIEFAKKKDTASNLKKNQIDYTQSVNDNLNKLTDVLKDIELYERFKDSIEFNKKIEIVLDSYKIKIKEEEKNIKVLNEKWMGYYSKVVSLTDQLEKIKKDIETTKKLEKEFEIYQLYMTAVNRDGLPYELITKCLPKIENEVNNILSQIVEFTMELRTDGKNIITNIVYEDKKWSLELCSGMEKFCSALALRVALMNVCSVPKCNFLAIDEGFAACDAEHMSMVHSLLSYLKTNFDFILIISHLDVMKDVVNSHLEINKNGEFSKISNI